jgi:hypothetical protein
LAAFLAAVASATSETALAGQAVEGRTNLQHASPKIGNIRRAVCGYQTRGYWQIFASLAHNIGDKASLADLKVTLARQRENYRFPSDEEFERALKETDLYGLRVCRHLLEGLENYGTKEPTDTSGYSIEHIMPQNDQLRPEWRKMLGESWKDVQKTWLHRLGNLTLTGYNSTYSDRPFDEKKTIKGGFADSAVRLNKFVREQPDWTPETMRIRTDALGACPSNRKSPSPAKQNSHWGKLR